ncbi:MAG: replication factor C small subunit [Thermoprotei archaeon]|jgi:replication factor C small subunit
MEEELMWAEKYRPKRLDDIINQDDIIRALKSFVKEKSVPHMLFAGPAGVGKTATAIAFARELYGENWRENTLELNASVSKDTPLLVKVNGRIKELAFEDLDKIYFNKNNNHATTEYVKVNDLDVLTEENRKIVWRKVKYLIRHKANKILRIKFEKGELKLTGNHSVMIIDENGDITTKHAYELKEKDYLISFTFNTNPNTNETTIEYSTLNNNGRSFLVQKLKVNELLGDVYNMDKLEFEGKVKIEWKENSSVNLLPIIPFMRFFERINGRMKINWRDALEHRLYNEEVASKNLLRELLLPVDTNSLSDEEKREYYKLMALINSDLHVVRIMKIETIDYDDYVYDVSVPGNEKFFAGALPILLHNSDERGIDTVRETIKERFARTLPVGDVPFKLIILDESDAMTADAQTALRRVMELFARNVRFILTCNYSNKIIEPIQSRTVVFRFSPLPKNKVIERLKFIAKNENVDVSEDGYEAIWDVSAGDMRKAINVLQSASALSSKITGDIIYKVAGMTRPKEVREVLNLALIGRFSDARDKLYELLYNYGLSGNDIISQIHKEVFRLNVDESVKIKILKMLGDYEYRLMEGSNEEIQLSSLLAQIALIGYESKIVQKEKP